MTVMPQVEDTSKDISVSPSRLVFSSTTSTLTTSHTDTLTPTHTHTLISTHTLTSTHTHTVTTIHTHTHTHTNTSTLTSTHTNTLTPTHTHTRTLTPPTPTLSLSPPTTPSPSPTPSSPPTPTPHFYIHPHLHTHPHRHPYLTTTATHTFTFTTTLTSSPPIPSPPLPPTPSPPPPPSPHLHPYLTTIATHTFTFTTTLTSSPPTPSPPPPSSPSPSPSPSPTPQDDMNPGTFYIPPEYAEVHKPTACRTVSQHAPVPDQPPKRSSVGNGTSGNSGRNRTGKNRVCFVDGPDSPPQETARSTASNPGAPPPRPEAPPPRSESTSASYDENAEEIYSRLSESVSGSSRRGGRQPLSRHKSGFSLNPPRPHRDIQRTSSVDYMSPSPMSDEHFDFSADEDGVALRRQPSRNPKGPECVDVEVFLTETDNTLRGVLELSTLHNDVINKVKMRVVLLFDVSGSMLLKCGRSRRHSKLSKLKKMAADLVDVLEEGDDFMGLVGFGEGTRVVCPLTKVDSRSRVNLKESISTVDQGIDSKTDLVNGILRAVELLKTGSQAYDPTYRNAIIVFSDGEINSGEVDPDKVVHTVRQRIRDTNPRPTNPNAALWLSVACVTTGGNVSEAMYLVSKYCGDDAYYYVDSDLDHPEVDMLIPLLLRKSAIAQCLTLNITSGNGAKLITEKCTREHSIRRRHEEKKSENVIYYLHDLQAGSQKHFSIAVDLSNFSRLSQSDVICINLEYVDANGGSHAISKKVRFGECLTPLKDPEKYDKGVLLSAKSDMRNVFQNSCRDAADMLQMNAESSPSKPLNEGKNKLHELMEHYGRMAKREETKTKVAEFSRALVENLDKLIESMEKSRRGAGHKWTKIKAVSSAVVRETPTVSKLVAQSEIVCPLPIFKSCETTRMTALALKLYRKQEVTSVVFPNQNLFDAAKVVMQSLSDIVNVLNEVEAVPANSATLRRNIITSMIVENDDSD